MDFQKETHGCKQAKAPRTIETATTSTSISRAPAPATSFVRGKSGFIPFQPGGLEDTFERRQDFELDDDPDGETQ